MTETKMERKIQVLLVDDHVIVRKGLRALLDESDDIEVIGEAGNGLEAIGKVDELEPDVVLMDLVMPEMDGVEAIALISAQHPGLRILVITTFSTDEQVFAAIKAGAHGYLLKDAGSDDLIDAIRQVHRGEPSLHPLVARKLMQEVAQPTTQNRTPEPLTARELEVLQLVAAGMTNGDIAAQLHVQEVWPSFQEELLWKRQERKHTKLYL